MNEGLLVIAVFVSSAVVGYWIRRKRYERERTTGPPRPIPEELRIKNAETWQRICSAAEKEKGTERE